MCGSETIGEANEVGVRVEPVRGSDGDDQIGNAELAAKPGDVESQRAQPRRRRSTVPDPVEERFGVDHGARLEGEQGEQGAAQRRARRVDHTVVIDHIDRPEQADCWHRHPLVVDPASDATRTSMTTVRDQSVAAVIAMADGVGEAGAVKQC